MTDRESVLQAHLSMWRRSAFVWGSSDCMMSIASYVLDITGHDVGAPWRGRYEDAAGGMKFVEAAGGGCALMDNGLTAIGLPRVDIARRGDPVCAEIHGMQIGGIYLGPMTAFRLEGRGQIDLRVKHLGVWRL